MKCKNFKLKLIANNFCYYCNIIKPDRVFHCKTCRKCVRKIDHHCSIVNNCVGFLNYKIFINMLAYAISTISIVIISYTENLKFYVAEYSICWFTSLFMFILISMIIIECLLIYFFIFHITLVLKGISQYEHTFSYPSKEPDYYDTIINKSMWTCFIDIFGTNPLYWFLPICNFFRFNYYILGIENSDSKKGYTFA